MMTNERTDTPADRLHAKELAACLAALSAADEGFAPHVTAAMDAAGVRGASVSAAEGRMLETFTRISGARKAVEIGSLYGYSAHWIARGLPEGARLYTLEKDPACVTAAKEAVEVSGLSRKVTVMEGPALDSLKTLAKLAPFDLCFIDADRGSYPAYLRWAAANLKPGGLVVAAGAFMNGETDPAAARAMREFFHVLFDSDRFASACVVPAGGGLAIGVKERA